MSQDKLYQGVYIEVYSNIDTMSTSNLRRCVFTAPSVMSFTYRLVDVTAKHFASTMDKPDSPMRLFR